MRGRGAIFLLIVVVSFVGGFMRPTAQEQVQEPRVLPHVEAINLYWSDDYEQVYEALEIFNTVLVEQPDNVEALAYRAAMNEGLYYNPEAATADYEQALALDPDSELVSALQAVAALEIEDFELARSKAEAAAKSGHPIAAFVLGRLASNDKDYEAALEYCTQALKDNLGLYANFTARLYAERGDAFYRLSRFEEALADVALSLGLAPENYRALSVQSRVSWSTKNVDEALVEGINGFWSSNYDVKPFDVFDAILLTHPDNAVALAYRGALYMSWHYDIEAAEADYARALELGAPAGLIEGLQAYTLYGEDETETTRAKAEASAQAGHAIGSFMLAWMTEYADETQEEAITHYTQALKDDDGLSPAFTVRLYTGRAEVLRLVSRFDEALADVEKALALDPDNYTALATRDSVGWSTKDVDVALAEGINLFWSDNSYQSMPVFEAILFTHPDNAVALTYQASFSYSEDVEAEYQKALALEPDPGLVEGLQALDAYEADDMETAETKARESIALGNPIGFYILGQIAYYADEEEDAYDFLTQAIEDDDHPSPSFTAQLYIYRGKSLYYLGRYEDAIVEINTGMALVPQDYEAVAFRGNIYRMLHQYPRALKDYNSALADHPDYMYALRGRADTYFFLGQYDEALLDANRVLADDPDNVFSLNTRGGVYKELGQYDDALIDYTHGLEIEPEDTYTLANRALLYLAMKDYSQALIDVNDALNLTPDDLYLLSVRGATYRLLEDYSKALADYNRVLEMAPNDDYAMEGRGHVYHDMGAYDNALVDFTHILERNPEHTAVLIRRARTYLALGRKLEAMADVNAALALEPENKDAKDLARRILR